MQQDINRCYMSHRGSVSSMSINTLNSVWCLLPMMQHWPWTSQLVCTSETDCFPANVTTALQTNQCSLRKLTDPFHAHFEQQKSSFSWFFTIWIKSSCTCSKNTQMNENITRMNLQFSKCQWAVPTFKNSLLKKRSGVESADIYFKMSAKYKVFVLRFFLRVSQY